MIAPMTDTPARFLTPDLLRRIAITLLALGLYRLAQWIPLPGIDTSALAQLAGPGSSFSFRAMTSIMTLGLLPLLSALLLAELAMSLSRRLRSSSETPHGRAMLWRTVVVGALFLTVFQSYGIVAAFEAMPGVVTERGTMFHAGVTASFIGATMLIVVLAQWITRAGVGSGFWVLFAASHVEAFFEPFILQAQFLAQGAVAPGNVLFGVALWLGFLALAAAILTALVKAKPPLSNPEELVCSPLLAGMALTLLLTALSLVQLTVPAVAPDVSALVTPATSTPLLALCLAAVVLLRRRSFLSRGTSLNVAAAVPAIVAMAALGSGWILFPNATSTLILVAVALMILENLRPAERDTASAPLAR